jgi:hypothetical protein
MQTGNTLKTAGRSGCGFSISLLVGGVSFLATAMLAPGQMPDTLLHSLFDPLGNSAAFGKSVAISGLRLVIGDSSSSNGNAYAYDLMSATPDEPAFPLTHANQAAGDRFGESVAISGTRVAVGCPGNGPGRVFLYDLASLTPDVPVITFTNVNLGLHDSALGVSVALSDRWMVAGAWQGGISSSPRGSAHVFDLNGVTPTVPTMILTNPGPALGSGGFGYSVALAGSRVVVGSPFNAAGPGISGSGSAYVYDLAGADPTQPFVVLTNPTPSLNGNFGRSVAISGNWVVTGSGWDDTSGFDAGIAYVYNLGSATPDTPALTLTNPSPASSDFFGASVAVSGNLVAVGAHGNDTGANRAGIVYVFDLASSVPTLPVATLTNPYPRQFASLGRAVAVDGLTVAAAPGVYVFGPRPILNLVLTAPNLATVSWTPTAPSGFALQFSASLPPTNWVSAPSGATNPIIIATTNALRFYRLFKL